MRISIDGDACTGHGRCYMHAPALFTDDERGYGVVVGNGEVADDQSAQAEAAVTGCPERAVALE